jgi:hypothetical protein
MGACVLHLWRCSRSVRVHSLQISSGDRHCFLQLYGCMVRWKVTLQVVFLAFLVLRTVTNRCS